MKRHYTHRPFGEDVVYTAVRELCPDCGRLLPIYQVDGRMVEGLDEIFCLKRRDKRCRPDCPGPRPIFLATRDLRVVLPGRVYGLEVTLYIGERHLCDGISLAQVTRELNNRGVPVDQRHTCRIFRDFMALTSLSRGEDETLCSKLCAQGGIILMCDGVQFEERSPVLYLVWDAISGTPLFGERKPRRGEDDLVPLLERVRAMNVPVIGVVTDKESGLVPAVKRVFPDVPYQYCQTHFLRNCAKPLKDDLRALQDGVRRRAKAVCKMAKRLSSSEESAKALPDDLAKPTTEPLAMLPSSEQLVVEAPGEKIDLHTGPPAAPLTEEKLVQEVCELVRVNSRVHGKAPLDPPELKRHERLEKLRTLVNDARKKKETPQDEKTRTQVEKTPTLAFPRRSEQGAQANLARSADRRAGSQAHRHPPRYCAPPIQRPRASRSALDGGGGKDTL